MDTFVKRATKTPIGLSLGLNHDVKHADFRVRFPSVYFRTRIQNRLSNSKNKAHQGRKVQADLRKQENTARIKKTAAVGKQDQTWAVHGDKPTRSKRMKLDAAASNMHQHEAKTAEELATQDAIAMKTKLGHP